MSDGKIRLKQLNQSGATEGSVPRWDGSNWAAAPGDYQVVFRPGGTAGGNVYTDWSDSVAAAQKFASVGSNVDLIVDTTDGAASTESGTYDMTNIRLIGGRNNVLHNTLTVVEGTVLNKFRYLERLRLEFTGSTPVVTDITGTTNPANADVDMFTMGRQSSIKCTGSGPFFDFTAGGLQYRVIVFEDEATWITGNYEVLDLAASGRFLGAMKYGTATVIQTDTIRGPVGSFVLPFLYTASSLDSQTQTNFAGGWLNFPFTEAQFVVFNSTSRPFTGATVQAAIDDAWGQYTTRHETLTPLAQGVSVDGVKSADFVETTMDNQPDVPRSIDVVFAGSWDGGNVKVTGVDQNGVATEETYLTIGAGTRVGVRAWAEITQIENLGTRTAGTVELVYSDKLGLICPVRNGASTGMVLYKTTVDGVHEAEGTVVQTQSTVVPITAPDGNKRFDFWIKWE